VIIDTFSDQIPFRSLLLGIIGVVVVVISAAATTTTSMGSATATEIRHDL
jgi:hypothetical protein